MATTVQLRCYWKQFDPGERLQAPGSLLCCCLFSFTSLLTPHRILVNTHTINKCAKFGSILLGVSREDDENIVSHRVSIKFWPSQVLILKFVNGSKTIKTCLRNLHTKFHSNSFSGSQEEDSWKWTNQNLMTAMFLDKSETKQHNLNTTFGTTVPSLVKLC